MDRALEGPPFECPDADLPRDGRQILRQQQKLALQSPVAKTHIGKEDLPPPLYWVHLRPSLLRRESTRFDRPLIR